MKNCDKIWGKLEENRDDGQYGWVVICDFRVKVHVQDGTFGCF